MPDESRDRAFMSQALELARLGAQRGEVPVGALVAREAICLGAAHNAPLTCRDPSAHAEILALREAARSEGAPRLPGTTLYVTLEPCLMCLGAALHARVERIVYAAPDPKIGAAGLLERLLEALAGFNHRPIIETGPLADESAALLREFFRRRREEGPRFVPPEESPPAGPC